MFSNATQIRDATLPNDHLFGIVARLTAIQEVPGSIPVYTLEIFLEV